MVRQPDGATLDECEIGLAHVGPPPRTQSARDAVRGEARHVLVIAQRRIVDSHDLEHPRVSAPSNEVALPERGRGKGSKELFVRPAIRPLPLDPPELGETAPVFAPIRQCEAASELVVLSAIRESHVDPCLVHVHPRFEPEVA